MLETEILVVWTNGLLSFYRVFLRACDPPRPQFFFLGASDSGVDSAAGKPITFLGEKLKPALGTELRDLFFVALWKLI